MKQLTEPKVEFIELSADVIATSGSNGCALDCSPDCISVCDVECGIVTCPQQKSN